MRELRLEKELRDTPMAYLLWLLFGAHYAYLGKWGLQILYWLTLGGLGFWALIDIFRIPRMVREHNDVIYAEIKLIKYKKL